MSLLIGNKIIKLTSVDSTNNYAMANMSSGNWQNGTIVQTLFQTQGKGQVGNQWESENGKNLLCSIALRTRFLPIDKQFMMSKVVSLSVAQVIEQYVNDVAIKWPNDIYVNDKKIAGILIENSIMGACMELSVAGIGLNINQQFFHSGAPNPVSLSQLTHREIEIETILDQLIKYMNHWYSALKTGDWKKIDESYSGALYRLGIPATYRDITGFFEGILLGVNPIGQLLIEDEKKTTRCYHFKEVTFVI